MPARQYYWFDTPDGEDILKKVDFAAKIGFLAGVPMTLINLALKPQPTLGLHAFRSAYIMAPFVGAGVTFALTTQLLCREFPKMDPRAAYVIGGASVGVVAGAALTKKTGTAIGFYSAIAAFVGRDLHNYPEIEVWGKKETVISNDVQFPDLRGTRKLELPPPLVQRARPASAIGTLE